LFSFMRSRRLCIASWTDFGKASLDKGALPAVRMAVTSPRCSGTDRERSSSTVVSFIEDGSAMSARWAAAVTPSSARAAPVRPVRTLSSTVHVPLRTIAVRMITVKTPRRQATAWQINSSRISASVYLLYLFRQAFRKLSQISDHGSPRTKKKGERVWEPRCPGCFVVASALLNDDLQAVLTEAGGLQYVHERLKCGGPAAATSFPGSDTE